MGNCAGTEGVGFVGVRLVNGLRWRQLHEGMQSGVLEGGAE